MGWSCVAGRSAVFYHGRPELVRAPVSRERTPSRSGRSTSARTTSRFSTTRWTSRSPTAIEEMRRWLHRRTPPRRSLAAACSTTSQSRITRWAEARTRARFVRSTPRNTGARPHPLQRFAPWTQTRRRRSAPSTRRSAAMAKPTQRWVSVLRTRLSSPRTCPPGHPAALRSSFPPVRCSPSRSPAACRLRG